MEKRRDFLASVCSFDIILCLQQTVTSTKCTRVHFVPISTSNQPKLNTTSKHSKVSRSDCDNGAIERNDGPFQRQIASKIDFCF